MTETALVVIDLQNAITKNYREVIDNVNTAINWSVSTGMHVVYIKNHGKGAWEVGKRGADLVPELKVVSENVFAKTKSNALTSDDFTSFIDDTGLREFYLVGADAISCVKSTAFNMAKAGYTVHVLSDCITSYAKDKIPEMLEYYANKGCIVETSAGAMENAKQRRTQK